MYKVFLILKKESNLKDELCRCSDKDETYKETLNEGEAMINTFQKNWQILTLIAEIVIYEISVQCKSGSPCA